MKLRRLSSGCFDPACLSLLMNAVLGTVHALDIQDEYIPQIKSSSPSPPSQSPDGPLGFPGMYLLDARRAVRSTHVVRVV